MKFTLLGDVYLRSSKSDYTVSHDPKHAPHYNSRLYSIYYPLIRKNLLCIEDTDRTHYPFLKQWVGMEIDVNNQWSVNNGILGLELRLHNNEKHVMHYMVRVKLEHAKVIMNAPLNMMGICNDRKRILFPLKLPMIDDLLMFFKMKVATDDYIKKNHLSPKGWSIE